MPNEQEPIGMPCLWVWIMDHTGVPALAITLPNGAITPAFVIPEPQLMLKFKRDTDAAYERFIPKPVREAMELLEDYSAAPVKKEEPPGTTGTGGVPAKI